MTVETKQFQLSPNTHLAADSLSSLSSVQQLRLVASNILSSIYFPLIEYHMTSQTIYQV